MGTGDEQVVRTCMYITVVNSKTTFRAYHLMYIIPFVPTPLCRPYLTIIPTGIRHTLIIFIFGVMDTAMDACGRTRWQSFNCVL